MGRNHTHGVLCHPCVYLVKNAGQRSCQKGRSLFCVLYKGASVAVAVWMFGCWEQGVASVSLVVRLAPYNECFCTHIVD